MKIANEDLHSDLAGWLAARPVWLQIAAARLLDGENITSEGIRELARMALDESLEDLKTAPPRLDLTSLGAVQGNAIRLRSLGNVRGIGNLNPRRPVSFGEAPIAVVYGSNGVGKSSYVRILKHACGARSKGHLHPNVFDDAEVAQGCTIGYRESGEDRELEWTPESGSAPELATVDIFDTHCGNSYLSKEERVRRQSRKNELDAIRWVHAQKPSIEAEVKRRQEVDILEKAMRLCQTTAISRKKGVLSEELLTPAYIRSFNDELRRLGARKVRVELARTRVDHGHVLHQVRLRDAKRSQTLHDILSEGEHRIVCIAAFLADVSAKPNASTFVFDDPISSLDLDFEEAVVQRLVELSRERQVVVFTHRLSLLGMVCDYAKKAEIATSVVRIRSEPWGGGEPGGADIECAKPRACLNQHLPTRIREARRILEENGEAAYRIHAQQICSEIRKLIERVVELELLADVVQRHRRAINTQGKIDKLSDITADDCRMVEDMMTKYSRYEHSQSDEAPVSLPGPDELEEDITALKTWRDSIEQRRK